MCHGQLSDKADVCSFGVVLLEIVTGKRNPDLTKPKDEAYLPIQAWKLRKESGLLDMKDPKLLVSEDEAEEVQRVLETAASCVQNAPEKRPSMFMVAAMLAGMGNLDHVGSSSDEIQPDMYDGWSQEIISDDIDDESYPLSGAAGIGDSLTRSSVIIELKSM